MSYEKHNFQSGSKLYASQLNEMDSQISDNTDALNKINTANSDDVGKVLKAKTVTDGKVTEWEFCDVGSSSDNSSQDIEYIDVQLPFTAIEKCVVKLAFFDTESSDSIKFSGLNEMGRTISTKSETKTAGSPIIEISDVVEDGYNCIKAHNAGTGYFSLTNKPLSVWGNDLWFGYLRVKVVNDQNPTYKVGVVNQILYNFGDSGRLRVSSTFDWEESYVIGTCNQIAAYQNMDAVIGCSQISGTVYIENITLVNLTKNGLTSVPVQTLLESARNHEFDISTDTIEFSANVSAAGETEQIVPYTSGIVVKTYNLTKGDSITVEQAKGYAFPVYTSQVGSVSGKVDIPDYLTIVKTRFYGKKVVFEGDSITDYDYLAAYEGKSWATYLQSILGLTLVSNAAVGGSWISNQVVSRIQSATYPNDVKLFVMMAGTNDYANNVPLGEANSSDTTTICGALNAILDKFFSSSPDSTVVIISPINRVNIDSVSSKNSAGYSLLDIYKAYQEVCSRWGAKVINGLEIGVNTLNSECLSRFYVDGLHPNPAGHQKIAVEVARIISAM